MTKKAAAQTQLQIYERLSQLDEETQERISQKYYHGTRPWNKKRTRPRKRRAKNEQNKTAEE